MIIAQYIPPIIEGCVAKAATKLGFEVLFDKGHYVEVTRNLIAKEGNPEKPKKYPLVWLVMDMREMMFPRLGIYADVDVHLIIAKDTLPAYTIDQRRDEIFLPTLYPIWEELINQFADCTDLSNSLTSLLKHEKYDRYYWGGQDAQGNGQANLFSDFIDAIQVKKITLSVKKQHCSTFSI